MIMQAPLVQTWPMLQALPQAPQLAGSLRVLTQLPEQLVVPEGQAQEPPTQAVPPVHAVPQAPQLLLLVWVFTQAPAQVAVPAGQVVTQAPLAQS
jgi:hypothetical protein